MNGRRSGSGSRPSGRSARPARRRPTPCGMTSLASTLIALRAQLESSWRAYPGGLTTLSVCGFGGRRHLTAGRLAVSSTRASSHYCILSRSDVSAISADPNSDPALVESARWLAAWSAESPRRPTWRSLLDALSSASAPTLSTCCRPDRLAADQRSNVHTIEDFAFDVESHGVPSRRPAGSSSPRGTPAATPRRRPAAPAVIIVFHPTA